MTVFFSARYRILALPLVLGLGSACLGDVEVPPDPPGLFPVESPTRRARQRVEGTKPAGTAVLNHGEVLVAHDAQEGWSAEVALQPGDNALDLTSQRKSGLASVEHTPGLIFYEPNFPAAPTLQPVLSPTREPLQNLQGARPTGSALWLSRVDGTGAVLSSSEFVQAGESTDWTAQLDLGAVDGLFHFSLVARDTRGRSSEPVDFEVELDRVPAQLVSRYPAVGEVDVPTNALIQVALDDALALSFDSLDPDILVVRDTAGTRPGGVLTYQALSHTLSLAVPLQPGTRYTATLDAGRFADSAGNQTVPAPADWVWSFDTGPGEDGNTPLPPTVELPAEVDPSSHRTRATELALSGTKPAPSSVWINGNEVVAIDGSTTWHASWTLNLGVNDLEIVARGRNGFSSAPVTLMVQRDAVQPAPPTLFPAPPATVNEALVVLEGTRDPSTSVLLNGLVVVPRGPDTSWVYNADLIPGVNDLELRCRDALGNLSEPLRVLVDYTQTYQGPVPAGFKLLVSFNLRDLSTAQPVASSFDTGANRYAVDAWIEGPLQPGESCSFDAASKERRGIDYVATLVHYVGQKQGHQNPFWDLDYRAPDYLAALVTGGVFESVGLGRNADRRNDQSGSQGGDLVDGTGRVRISNEDLDLIDGVTEATTLPGLKVLEWLPLDRNLQRIPQGEYLVHILLSLDRDPGWVASADTETCWGDTSFSARGQHRIVKRLGLGSTGFNVTLGQATEESAPDVERGASQLRYLDPGGITFRWVKAP
ncbi:MAG: Ig-like domain-containing protein [Pseudomonadota bacterium]